MRRRLFLATMIGALAIGLVGCGKSDKPDAPQGSSQEVSQEVSGQESEVESGSDEFESESTEEGSEIIIDATDKDETLEASLLRHAREAFESADQRYAFSIHLEQDRTYYSVYTDESGAEVRSEDGSQYDYVSELDFEVDHDYQCTGVTISGTEAGKEVDTDVYIEDTEIAYTVFLSGIDEESGRKTAWSFYSNPAGSMVQIGAPDWEELGKTASAEKTEDGRYRLKVSAPLSLASQIGAYYSGYGIYQESIEEPVTVVFMFTADREFESCHVYNEDVIEVTGGVIRKYSAVISAGAGGLLEDGAVPMEVKKEAYGL